IAHRTSIYLDRKDHHSFFIWTTLIIHGLIFSAAAFMPSLVLFAVLIFISRTIIGVEYAIQETLFQRSLPDLIRGRISTIDRGAELTMFGTSSYVSAVLMYYISPMTLTFISGLLSAGAGVVWFVRHRRESFLSDEEPGGAEAPA